MATSQRASRKPRRVRRLTTTSDAPRPTEAIRWSKVIDAQTRIASGHYDRDAVRSRLVDAVLRALKTS